MLGYKIYFNVKNKWLKWSLILLYESICIWVLFYLLLSGSAIIDVLFYLGIIFVGVIVIYGQLTRFNKK